MPGNSHQCQATEKNVLQLLNYAATQPEAITRYHSSVVGLHIHSDTSFLSTPGSKIRVGGYHYLSLSSADPNAPPPKSTYPQRSHTRGMCHYEERLYNCCGIRTWIIICKLLVWCFPKNCPQLNGTPAATCTIRRRRRNSGWIF